MNMIEKATFRSADGSEVELSNIDDTSLKALSDLIREHLAVKPPRKKQVRQAAVRNNKLLNSSQLEDLTELSQYTAESGQATTVATFARERGVTYSQASARLKYLVENGFADRIKEEGKNRYFYRMSS
jgi:Fic family protein